MRDASDKADLIKQLMLDPCCTTKLSSSLPHIGFYFRKQMQYNVLCVVKLLWHKNTTVSNYT